jgi:hypothetical protein
VAHLNAEGRSGEKAGQGRPDGTRSKGTAGKGKTRVAEKRVSRRAFLGHLGGAALCAAGPYVLTSGALGSGAKAPASERVTLGHIGVGARGLSQAGWFGPESQSVAVCDPFRSRREAAARQLDAKPYRDLRELVARDDLDAVIVSTVDHWHVLAATMAAKAGKDVYCEKPMGLCLGWDLALRDAVRRHGRVFQYGTQAVSYHNVRRCCEMVRSGYIGDLRQVQVSCGPGAQGQTDVPRPVPDDLDYELWLGPAPSRPYFGQPLTQGSWIHIHDYSVGWIGGMGAHSMSAALLGFDAHTRGPLEVEATGEVSRGVRDTLHRWQARIRFADGATMTFSSGQDGTRFVGTTGWLEPANVVYAVSSGAGGGIRASSPALAKAPERPGDVHLGRARGGHGGEFIRAVKDRGPTTAGVDLALRSETIIHLTDIAVRTGRTITWDPVKEQVLGDEEASRLVHRSLREPWRI